MKKITTVFIGLLFIAAVATTVSAQSGSITDPTGDVIHFRYSETSWGWDVNIENKPNIDITEISWAVSGESLRINFEVVGEIVDSDLITYYCYFNTTDSNYLFSWHDSEGFGLGMNAQGTEMDYNPTITASGNTLTAIFNVVGTFTSDIEVWGFAIEYTVFGDQSAEWWADWAPNEYSPYYDEYTNDDPDDPDDEDDPVPPTNGNDQTTPPPNDENGTPGFEFLALLAALGAALILIKKRK
ncbi:MAG: hypothetical protein R6V50_00365 [Thermoplasmatota archaeon]